jgi:hypothetical protein
VIVKLILDLVERGFPPRLAAVADMANSLRDQRNLDHVGTNLSSGKAWDESCHCGISVAKGSLYEVCPLGANRMKQRCNSPSVVLLGYGSLHKACRLRTQRCNVGASSNLLGYGRLHKACWLRADGWDENNGASSDQLHRPEASRLLPRSSV